MTRLDFLECHVQRLAEALAALRARVREAVAAELGKAVGRTVQDVVEAVARGRPPADAGDPRRGADDDDDPAADPWDEDDPVATWRLRDDADADAVPAPRSTALAATVRSAWRRWSARCGRVGLGVVVRLAINTVARGGGPLVAAGLRVVTLAADLLALGRPAPPPTPL